MGGKRPLGYYLLFIWILYLYIFAGYCALNFKKEELTTIVNMTMTIPKDFRSRLAKHGLDKQVSLIEIRGGKLYFYRDGKRCKF